jgi:hypothetical protein
MPENTLLKIILETGIKEPTDDLRKFNSEN